ncbi:nitroreductase [Ancylomarina euxinus]|uniref:Nitroreductase n=1 Tax=Ancylomarina euxinus TaxID=2283627 RepID=A0A425XWA5_9BACT|nr:nitroreductase family protein [Ancylomarina euxinus]MCZ4696484.1 nitroreductase family protein [Ancylomarina euxinus]RRG18935.1 nitroreductase [Ancylomarina euxinus]
MKVLEVIKNRRSIRKYTNQEPDSDIIKNVLHAGNWAPSAGNHQPWEFIVVKGEVKSGISQEFYNFAKDYIPKAAYIPEDQKARMLEYSKDFGGAPIQIIVSYPNLEDNEKKEEALKASCAAIQNILLQATQNGLGTVWVDGNITHSKKVKELIGLSNDRSIAGIIPIGYPDSNPPAPPRQDSELNEKVKWLGF